jgi:signal recognition particle receptor subunit alpha
MGIFGKFRKTISAPSKDLMLELFAIVSKTGRLTFLYNPFAHAHYVGFLNRIIEDVLVYQRAKPGASFALTVDERTWSVQFADQGPVLWVACAPTDIPLAGSHVPVLFDKLGAISGPLDVAVFERLVQEAEREMTSPASKSKKGSTDNSNARDGGGLPPKDGRKQGRKWDDRVDKEEQRKLDYSSMSSTNYPPPKPSPQASSPFPTIIGDVKVIKTMEDGKPGFWATLGKLAAGSRILDEATLDPVCRQLQDQLIEKNVAVTLAEDLAGSVKQRLLRASSSPSPTNETGPSSSLEGAVTKAAADLIRPLVGSQTPSQLLAHIRAKLSPSTATTNDPQYRIVFVGLNGVGKSTTLAKVAAWLLGNQLRVLIVAGDTFRAGAVEQLQRHVTNLQSAHGDRVALFDKGYGRDASTVVDMALQQTLPKAKGRDSPSIGAEDKASDKHVYDVVLVDTAGRMPSNQPLMQSLHRLVCTARPDRVWFVGEALVGNDSLMQLRQFNDSLAPEHRIDGLVISKFDTVDDKIGTVLNLSHAARCPVVFVGCGQTYGDLRTLQVDDVVDSLLS